MSIRKITPDNFENFTLETHPARVYSSGSASSLLPGISGTLNVFSRHSTIEKETVPLSQFSASFFNDQNLDELLSNALTTASSSNNNLAQVESYMSGVFAQQPSARKQKTLDIRRFLPTVDFTSNTAKKMTVLNTLMPFYRTTSSDYNYNFTNYNTFNFLTSSAWNTGSVVLYPNPSVTGAIYGQYTPTGSWTIDFWINPRYTTDAEGLAFKAGTIMHLSGVFAVSLVTGSQRDIRGLPVGYRILVQLSTSAGITPTAATTSSLCFYSSDNALTRNHWHHVAIRHGGPSPLYNAGSGSIVIDGALNTTFFLTTSIASPSATGGYGVTDGPNVLCIGNFYEGPNSSSSGISRFFASDVADRDGLYELNTEAGIDYPTSYSFNHPLNAEVHDLKIYNKYRTLQDITSSMNTGETSLSGVLFYVPPFFTKEAPSRSFVGTYGGVMQTPFQEANGTTSDPFNVTMSFGIGGMYMNLENYARDFATGRFPRWLRLTGSVLGTNTGLASANEFLFATGSNRQRQYIIMPCDNGKFYPNFDLLSTGSLDKFTNDLGTLSKGVVSLRNMVPLDTQRTFGLSAPTGSIIDGIIGSTPENLSGTFRNDLAILHRTMDNTSNQVVFFDTSNLYYGMKIRPSTLVLTDAAMSASGEKIGVILKDDGIGNLYRANALSDNATWASVGNVFYNEGLVVVKSPQLCFFGDQQWKMEFDGIQNIHTLKFDLLLPSLTSISSSNPSFMPISASSLANDTDQQFVWITGIYLHDDNLNVIAKSHLAQPIMKRTGDKSTYRIKFDF